jgi:hypothetical protein
VLDGRTETSAVRCRGVGRIVSRLAMRLARFAVPPGREQLGHAGVALRAWWRGELLPDGGMGQGPRILRPGVAERALGPHARLAVVLPQTSWEQWW